MCDSHLADEVDLEMAAEVVERHALDRSADHDPGVVHKRAEPIGQGLDKRADMIGVGDVKRDRHKATAAAASGSPEATNTKMTAMSRPATTAERRRVAHRRWHEETRAREQHRRGDFNLRGEDHRELILTTAGRIGT